MGMGTFQVTEIMYEADSNYTVFLPLFVGVDVSLVFVAHENGGVKRIS